MACSESDPYNCGSRVKNSRSYFRCRGRSVTFAIRHALETLQRHYKTRTCTTISDCSHQVYTERHSDRRGVAFCTSVQWETRSEMISSLSNQGFKYNPGRASNCLLIIHEQRMISMMLEYRRTAQACAIPITPKASYHSLTGSQKVCTRHNDLDHYSR
jgi:hypothetical protein